MAGFLRFNLPDINSLKKRYDPKIVDKAFSQAISRSTAKAATLISKETRKRYNVTAGAIRERISIQRAARDHQRAILYIGRKLLLKQFSPTSRMIKVDVRRNGKTHKARRQRVSVRVRKDIGRQIATGAWLAKGQILRRAVKNDNHSEPRMQFGPSIPHMVDNPETIKAVQNMVREDLPKQFSDRMEWLLRKAVGVTI